MKKHMHRGVLAMASVGIAAGLVAGVSIPAFASQYNGSNGCGGIYSPFINTNSVGGSGVSYNNSYGNPVPFSFGSGAHQTALANKSGYWSAGSNTWYSAPYISCT